MSNECTYAMSPRRKIDEYVKWEKKLMYVVFIKLYNITSILFLHAVVFMSHEHIYAKWNMLEPEIE